MTEIAFGASLYLGLQLIWSARIESNLKSTRAIEKYLKSSQQTQISFSLRIFQILKPIIQNVKFNPWGSDIEISDALLASSNKQTVAEFRVKQVVTMLWVQSGIIAWHIAHYLSTAHSAILLTATLLVMSTPLSGAVQLALMKDRVRRRSRIIDAELAGMLDLLAFSVSAGEPIVGAIGRVGRVCDGLVARLFRQVSGQLAEGKSINQCLSEVARSTSSKSFARAIRAIQNAIERGTPLATVLRAQAQDARASLTASHMKEAGKREAAMMIPVVFLILPMIVFITLYPGLRALQLA